MPRFFINRPIVAIVISIGLSLLFTWLGLAIAYFAPYAVVGFYITSLAFGTYVCVRFFDLVQHQRAHGASPTRTRMAA